MAIMTQYPHIDGNGKERNDLIRTYSSVGLQILQIETGAVYDEAVDIYPSKYTYTETDQYVEEETETDYRTAYNNLAAEVLSNE